MGNIDQSEKKKGGNGTLFTPSLLNALLISALAFVMVYARPFLIGAVNVYKRDLCGRIVLITGSNTGLGYAMAEEMLAMNATVILVGRDRARVDAAALRLLVNVNPNSCAKLDSSFLLDLASLSSVRSFAEAFLKKYSKLDILVLNAGVFHIPKGRTVDGLETTLQVNHLGHHLLYSLLEPIVFETAKETSDVRVLVLSSSGQFWGDLSGDALSDLNFEKRIDVQQGYQLYTQSKLCNVLFAKELARRTGVKSGVSSYSIDPGAVATDIFRHYPPIIEKAFNILFKTPKQGAQTQIYLAAAPLSEIQRFNGGFFSDCAHSSWINPQALNETLAKELWSISDQLVGITTQ